MIVDGYQHIDESDQLRYVDGELDEAEVEIVEGHLATCSACRDTVDDLAAASDGLTAFLQQSDFPPRAMTYQGAASRSWWASPWALGSALAMLLGGVGLVTVRSHASRPGPAAIAVPRADRAPGPVLVVEPDAPVVPEPNAPVVPAPDAPVVVVPEPAPPAVAPPVAGPFTVEVTSWQSGGSLAIVFADTDVFMYRQSHEGNTTTSINTLRGYMVINTTADSDTDHEVIVPRTLRGRITVRVAGQDIPLSADAAGVTMVMGGAGTVAMVRLDLDHAHRPR